MPLAPYIYRPSTPPIAVPELDYLDANGSPSFSETSTISGQGYNDTLHIHVSSTPHDRSPIRQHGPALLPKIRTQDQSFETRTHRRAVSQSFVPPPPQAIRPPYQRSTTVPPEFDPFTPLSAISTSSSAFPFLSPITPVIHSTNVSPITITPPTRPTAGHSRSTSASCINEYTLSKYSYYQQPSYSFPTAYWTSSGSTSSIYTPAPVQQSIIFDLPEEQQCTDPTGATMTPLEYMRLENPKFGLVRASNKVLSKTAPHYWFDVRNLESWSDFNLDTIMKVEGFKALLNMPVPDNASVYPQPQIGVSRTHPETLSCLVDIIKDFYLTKVNALTKITQGNHRYMATRVNKDKNGPTFISSYQDDIDRTIIGNGRGRLVGIALPWNRWNIGNRHGVGSDRILYLDGLATLHYHMRQSQCRYGFIMNETELICVRAGDLDIPFFGHLEVSPVIEARKTTGLTTCLALWYLSMLAKEQPLAGQCSWKINVGPAANMSRQHVKAEKDSWIPKPNTLEMRCAKRVRGWVWPSDPWNKKKEGGKVFAR